MSETTTETKSVPSIYPFYFETWEAEDYIRHYAEKELKEGTEKLYGRWDLTYIAQLLEDGSLKLSCRYSEDRGWCQSCGNLFPTKIVRPFSEKGLANIIRNRKYQYAEVEFERREAEKRDAAIRKIQAELFGEEPENDR